MDDLIMHNWFEWNGCVVGSIYNDPRRTNPNDGSIQSTSKILSIDRENGILITKNTTYQLGFELVIVEDAKRRRV